MQSNNGGNLATQPRQCAQIKVPTMRKPPAMKIMTMDDVGPPLPRSQEMPCVWKVEILLSRI